MFKIAEFTPFELLLLLQFEPSCHSGSTVEIFDNDIVAHPNCIPAWSSLRDKGILLDHDTMPQYLLPLTDIGFQVINTPAFSIFRSIYNEYLINPEDPEDFLGLSMDKVDGEFTVTSLLGLIRKIIAISSTSQFVA